MELELEGLLVWPEVWKAAFKDHSTTLNLKQKINTEMVARELTEGARNDTY